jgi:hypothetical protein
VVPDDPAVTGFHEIIARDGAGISPHRDLAAGPRCAHAHAGRCARDASRGTLIALLLKSITEI